MNNLRNNFVKYLLLSFLLIALINEDSSVLGKSIFPGKAFSEAGAKRPGLGKPVNGISGHGKPGHGIPGHKVLENPGDKFGSVTDDFAKSNNVDKDDLKNDKSYEGNKETEKTKSSKDSNPLILAIIALLILVVLSSIYAWFKHRNRKNAGGNDNYV